MVRPFHSFHSFRLLRSSSVHSCAPAAHAPVTATLCHARFAHTHSLTHSFRSSVHSCALAAHASVTTTLAWHFVPCSLRSHSFTSLLHSFVPLLRSITHSTHFTSDPFHMLSAYARFLC